MESEADSTQLEDIELIVGLRRVTSMWTNRMPATTAPTVARWIVGSSYQSSTLP